MHIRPFTIEGGLERLFAATAELPYAFFLESGLPAGGLGRYSFIGYDPFAVWRVRPGGDAEVCWRDGRIERLPGEPLMALRAFHARFTVESAPGARLPFAGGAVGFFSYEFGLRFEGIVRTSPDDLVLPEAESAFYDAVIACDQETGEIMLASALADQAAAEAAMTRIETIAREALAQQREQSAQSSRREPVRLTSNFTQAAYEDAVRRVKDFIRSGDVYQINLSQRFEMPLLETPARLYARLRRKSPAPYGCFLNFGALQVAGVSPERFLRVENGCVITRPIKGTRPRGRDAEEDAALKNELAQSTKDRAELLMIVDLERNDLGRVCVPGSISVAELFALEAHPTVWHQVAEISGRLAPGRDIFDCVRAAFPGGSITGAPKVRAMQIIDELEPHRRHLYTGAMGYLGFDGRAELNIAIRTITCTNGRAYFHAGGGVVWDSDPTAEYEETLTKARALRAALEAAGDDS